MSVLRAGQGVLLTDTMGRSLFAVLCSFLEDELTRAGKGESYRSQEEPGTLWSPGFDSGRWMGGTIVGRHF